MQDDAKTNPEERRMIDENSNRILQSLWWWMVLNEGYARHLLRSPFWIAYELACWSRFWEGGQEVLRNGVSVGPLEGRQAEWSGIRMWISCMTAVGAARGTEWLAFEICFSCALTVDVFSLSWTSKQTQSLHSGRKTTPHMFIDSAKALYLLPAAFDLGRHDVSTFEG